MLVDRHSVHVHSVNVKFQTLCSCGGNSVNARKNMMICVCTYPMYLYKVFWTDLESFAGRSTSVQAWIMYEMA